MDVDEVDLAVLLQSEASLQPDDACRLWRLPIAPVFKEQKGVGPMKDAGINWATYQKRCYLIAKNWETRQPEHWIPQDLLNTTPYSFALVDALYHVTKVSKRLRTDCHDYLLQSVRKRSSIIANATDPWIETATTGSGYETVIRERLDGVLLADIAALNQAITSGEIKTARIERSKKETEHSKAKALKRVLDRREAKVTTQVTMQRELWDEKAGRAELVGIEFGNDNGHAEPGVLSKKKLNRLAKQMHKSHAIAEFLRAKKSARENSQSTSKNRAATLDQLAAKLKEDEENAWTDNSDDDADLTAPHRVMPEPNELEPRAHQSRKARRIGQVPNMVGSIAVEETSDYVVKPPVHDRKKWSRSPKTVERKRRETEEWYKEKLSQSVQLPSERFDFSQLPKLESNAQRESIDGMMGALNSMGVDQPQ